MMDGKQGAACAGFLDGAGRVEFARGGSSGALGLLAAELDRAGALLAGEVWRLQWAGEQLHELSVVLGGGKASMVANPGRSGACRRKASVERGNTYYGLGFVQMSSPTNAACPYDFIGCGGSLAWEIESLVGGSWWRLEVLEPASRQVKGKGDEDMT